MATDTERAAIQQEILASWARTLTDERLALDLESIANRAANRNPKDRAALLREAAHRLRNTTRANRA